jgi:putative hydrolase of the HAD superfamily
MQEYMIKTVIFDLGRVIVPFDFMRTYRRLEPLCGIPAEEISGRLSQTGLISRYESGLIESRDFADRISRHLGLKVSYEEFCDLWMSIFLPDTLVPEEMLAEIAAVRRLVLLSNTNEIHFAGIRRNYPLLRHFNEFVLSHEVRAMKPSPEIYRRAIEVAQCAPEECFFTDDIQDYVDGAKKMGIDAVRFESAAQIREELRRRGVLA